MITLSALSKEYRTDEICVPVLRDITLSINKGEFVAIMGPSGSGKSTLMNVIGCLDRFDTGLLQLGEHAITGERHVSLDTQVPSDATLANIRSQTIGFVFQGFNLIPRMSAQRNVELPMMYRGLAREARQQRAIDLLTEVGLAERTTHRPAQLSGGQQQRVSIARALANNPSLLIADEPTGSLDTATSEEILDLFKQLHAQGMTILMVTHDKPVALRADRVIELRDGRVVSPDYSDTAT